MKQFKYKLDTILKLRDFEKKKIEFELGAINKKILSLTRTIEDIKKQIHDTQEAVNMKDHNDQLDNSLVRFFPQFLQAKTREVTINKDKLAEAEKERNEIIKNLNDASGKVKILEKDKINKKQIFKKEQLKKENLSREDLQIITRGRKSI